MKPYSSYKPSGIPWLAPIPAHWETKRAKRLFHKMERPPQHNDKVVTCFRDGAVTLRENRRTEGFTESLQEIGYQGIREGDLVVHNMDAFAGAIGVSDSDGKGTPVYSVCTMTPDANAHYYAATIREMARSQWVTALATGIRERSTDFRYATLAQQILPVPPPDEQAAIVRFLDHNDELINRYISAKERLIALLEEQRQAVIHQAVTQGLGQTVPVKHSDIPELGVIPNHWKTISLGQLGSFSKGGGGTKDDQVEEGIPCVRYGDIYTSHKYFVRKTTSFIAPTRVHDYARMQYGDVLFTGSGETIEDIGKSVVNLIHGEAYCGGDVIMLRPHGETVPKFLGYLLDSPSLIHQKSSIGRGITIMHVYSSQLKYIRLALPPLSEQAEIGEFLEKATRTANNAIDNAKQQIDLMNEYRTRLIADVVTGQLDVRSADANDLDMLEAHS